MDEKEQMVTEKSWTEFRDSGLLWFVNTILNAFGWSLEEKYDESGFVGCYPARTKFRGYSKQGNDMGYAKIARYMAENGLDLLKDVRNDD